MTSGTTGVQPENPIQDKPVWAWGTEVLSLIPHKHRDAVLQEVHARPFRPISTPARIFHFAFMSDAASVKQDKLELKHFCELHGVEAPQENARQHQVAIDGASLRWEQHSEFTTYSWRTAAQADANGQSLKAEISEVVSVLPQSNPLLVSVELLVIKGEGAPAIDQMFNTDSLCVMTTHDGLAIIATDFQPGANGSVRILVIDHGLTPIRVGALVQRLLELETYRVLALLGLPEAQRVAPLVHEIEQGLVEATHQMTTCDTLEDNQQLLDQLVQMAAKLESVAAEVSYRFGASRAYQNIVQSRLTDIGFEPIPERESFAAFLNRRLNPALRTCASIEERQINLSRKLARATQLLRAKVDVGMERQNREILSTLSERAHMQLRLQQTVEGLSIAAISYYVMGILGHGFVALPYVGVPINPEIATAVSIPVIVGTLALIIRKRLRAHNATMASYKTH